MSCSTSRSPGVRAANGSRSRRRPTRWGNDLGVDDRSALCDAAGCVHQPVDVGDPVLEKIADAAGAVGDQLEGVVGLDICDKISTPAPRQSLLDLQRRSEAVVG